MHVLLPCNFFLANGSLSSAYLLFQIYVSLCLVLSFFSSLRSFYIFIISFWAKHFFLASSPLICIEYAMLQVRLLPFIFYFYTQDDDGGRCSEWWSVGARNYYYHMKNVHKANKLLFTSSACAFLLLCSSVWRELFIFVCIMQIAGSMRQMERCSHLRHLRGRPTSHFIKLCKCNYLWHPESFLALNIHNGTVSSAINAICRPTIPFFFRIYNLYFRNCDAFSVYFNR